MLNLQTTQDGCPSLRPTGTHLDELAGILVLLKVGLTQFQHQRLL